MLNVNGTIGEGDVVIFFNYRNDRAKELTYVLTQQVLCQSKVCHTIKGFAILLYDTIRC